MCSPCVEADHDDAAALHESDPQVGFVPLEGCEDPQNFPRPVVAGFTPKEVLFRQLRQRGEDVEVGLSKLVGALPGVAGELYVALYNRAPDAGEEGSEGGRSGIHGGSLCT